jgi:hypothetical protein
MNIHAGSNPHTPKGPRATSEELDAASKVWEGTLDAQIEDALSRNIPKGRQFLLKRLDWPELCLVARLGHGALAVWLLVHLRWPLREQGWITLPPNRLAEMGVGPWAKRRAIAALEAEGLIRVRRGKGRAIRVALVREGR